jgi:hypothetical protein
MAGVNIDNVGLTFTHYIQGVVDTLQQKSKLRSMLRNDHKWSGSHVEGRVHVARSTAVGNVEDGGAFPVADKQDYATYKAYRKFTVGSIQLTDGVMATAKEGKDVAKGVLTSEVKGMMTGILKYENGMLYRDGTGSLCQISDASIGASDTAVRVTDARMLWEGLTVQVYSNSGGAPSTLRGSMKVLNVTEEPNSDGTFTVNFDTSGPYSGVIGSSGVSAATTDHLVWNNSINRAVTGLDKLIDDAATTFQNVNVSTYPRYSSLVLDNSGANRALTPSLFRKMLAGIHQKSGSELPNSGLTVLCNAWQAINVEELYEGELRLAPSDKTGGLSVAAFQSSLGRINIQVDLDCLHNKMFFVDLSKIHRAVQQELQWRKQGDSIFLRSDVSGIHTATAIEISELFIKERFTSGKIEDLSQDPASAY